MSFNFILPVPDSKVKKKSEKNYELEPNRRGSKVISPYDGAIINDNTYNSCSDKDTSFVIKHRVGGDIFYSVICNIIPDPTYVPGIHLK